MITVVTYLWDWKRRARYTPAHVQRLAESVDRWLSVPHRVICITHHHVPGVQTMVNPAPQYADRCYRRLWLFSKAARRLGERILHLDLDLVICGPLDRLVQREASLVVYKAGSIAARGYSLNPSVLWLQTGTQTDIWDQYRRSPGLLAQRAKLDGWWGSDQAILSYLRHESGVETFGDEDGIVSFRRIRHEHLTEPPPGTCIVSFHGRRTPFEREVQDEHPWIQDAWAEVA